VAPRSHPIPTLAIGPIAGALALTSCSSYVDGTVPEALIGRWHLVERVPVSEPTPSTWPHHFRDEGCNFLVSSVFELTSEGGVEITYYDAEEGCSSWTSQWSYALFGESQRTLTACSDKRSDSLDQWDPRCETEDDPAEPALVRTCELRKLELVCTSEQLFGDAFETRTYVGPECQRDGECPGSRVCAHGLCADPLP
jgi:hypothetical protein